MKRPNHFAGKVCFCQDLAETFCRATNLDRPATFSSPKLSCQHADGANLQFMVDGAWMVRGLVVCLRLGAGAHAVVLYILHGMKSRGKENAGDDIRYNNHNNAFIIYYSGFVFQNRHFWSYISRGVAAFFYLRKYFWLHTRSSFF